MSVLILDTHADWYAAQLRAALSGLEFLAAATAQEAIAQGQGARVLVGLGPRLTEDVIAALPDLEWVQALTTGVDNLLASSAMGGQVVLTNCGGFHGPQMSELAILLMLACARRLPKMLNNQRDARWDRWEQPVLRGKTLCVVGLGSIAEYLAHVAGALGMWVTGVSDGRSAAPGFDQIYARAQINDAAAGADFLVVLVPYAPKTHHIINAQVFQAMPKSAYLINIARGGCVDEAALIEALDQGQIAGAGLDVFGVEPLPENSPFWQREDVIITPHIGGFADIYREQALPILIENMTAYVTGGLDALPNLNLPNLKGAM